MLGFLEVPSKMPTSPTSTHSPGPNFSLSPTCEQVCSFVGPETAPSLPSPITIDSIQTSSQLVSSQNIAKEVVAVFGDSDFAGREAMELMNCVVLDLTKMANSNSAKTLFGAIHYRFPSPFASTAYFDHIPLTASLDLLKELLPAFAERRNIKNRNTNSGTFALLAVLRALRLFSPPSECAGSAVSSSLAANFDSDDRLIILLSSRSSRKALSTPSRLSNKVREALKASKVTLCLASTDKGALVDDDLIVSDSVYISPTYSTACGILFSSANKKISSDCGKFYFSFLRREGSDSTPILPIKNVVTDTSYQMPEKECKQEKVTLSMGSVENTTTKIELNTEIKASSIEDEKDVAISVDSTHQSDQRQTTSLPSKSQTQVEKLSSTCSILSVQSQQVKRRKSGVSSDTGNENLLLKKQKMQSTRAKKSAVYLYESSKYPSGSKIECSALSSPHTPIASLPMLGQGSASGVNMIGPQGRVSFSLNTHQQVPSPPQESEMPKFMYMQRGSQSPLFSQQEAKSQVNQAQFWRGMFFWDVNPSQQLQATLIAKMAVPHQATDQKSCLVHYILEHETVLTVSQTIPISDAQKNHILTRSPREVVELFCEQKSFVAQNQISGHQDSPLFTRFLCELLHSHAIALVSIPKNSQHMKLIFFNFQDRLFLVGSSDARAAQLTVPIGIDAQRQSSVTNNQSLDSLVFERGISASRSLEPTPTISKNVYTGPELLDGCRNQQLSNPQVRYSPMISYQMARRRNIAPSNQNYTGSDVARGSAHIHSESSRPVQSFASSVSESFPTNVDALNKNPYHAAETAAIRMRVLKELEANYVSSLANPSYSMEYQNVEKQFRGQRLAEPFQMHAQIMASEGQSRRIQSTNLQPDGNAIDQFNAMQEAKFHQQQQYQQIQREIERQQSFQHHGR